MPEPQLEKVLEAIPELKGPFLEYLKKQNKTIQQNFSKILIDGTG
jgi:hypothetical protein